MKEINFYKDDFSCSQIIYDTAYRTHNDTVDAISNDEPVIHTFAISALSFAYLLDKGYKIYLHENCKSFEIKVGHVEATDKEIRKAHDIRTIWIGGGFNRFFYQ